jgi:hypothetical protein
MSSTPTIQLPARWLWTLMTFFAFSRELPGDWPITSLWSLAVNSAELHAEDNNVKGWLIGRNRVTPSEAVQGELECWTE